MSTEAPLDQSVKENIDRQDQLERSPLATQLGMRWGVIGGWVLIFYGLGRYLIDAQLYVSAWLVGFTYAIIVAFMVVSIVKLAKAQDNFALFKQALKVAFLTSSICLFMVSSLSVIMFKVVDPNLVKYQKINAIQSRTSMMEALGKSPQEIEAEIELMEDDNYDLTYKQIAGAFGLQLIIGFLWALIMATVCYLVYKDKVPLRLAE